MQIKSIFTRKDFSLSLVLKGRVFRTWGWPISILETSKGLGTNALSFIWLKSESGRYLKVESSILAGDSNFFRSISKLYLISISNFITIVWLVDLKVKLPFELTFKSYVVSA